MTTEPQSSAQPQPQAPAQPPFPQRPFGPAPSGRPSFGPGGPRRRDAGGPAGGPRRGGRFQARRKVCMFCVEKVQVIDYKDVLRLRRFMSDRAKIDPRRKSGTCARHQRDLADAIKRARHLAMLPFTQDHIRMTGWSG